MLEQGPSPGSWKEQMSGKSKAGLLYTVGSKQMEPLSPELVPNENTNTVREGSIHLCCLGTFLISELKISEDNQIL